MLPLPPLVTTLTLPLALLVATPASESKFATLERNLDPGLVPFFFWAPILREGAKPQSAPNASADAISVRGLLISTSRKLSLSGLSVSPCPRGHAFETETRTESEQTRQPALLEDPWPGLVWC